LPTTYSRSDDGGQTWPVSLTMLPGYDTSRQVRGGGDQYAIDVDGDNVAIVIADNLGGDVSLWKSTDGGQSFNKTVVDTFEFAPYASNKVIGSNVATNDGTVDVTLDANGYAHVFWGYSEVNQTNASTDSATFVPASNRIVYWNEQNNTKQVIGGMTDMNGDGVLTVATGTFRSLAANNALPRLQDANGNIIDLISVARYGNTSLATMPSALVDGQRIFCVYSAPLEGDVYLSDTNTSSNFRDVFVVYSTDGGQNWSDPQNLTQGHQVEDVFGCLGKRIVNNVLHLVWQRDDFPGTNLQNNSSDGSHPTVNNVILHAAIPVQAILNNQIGLGPGVGIKEVSQNVYITSGFYPNPTNNGGEVEIYLTETTPVTVSVSNLLGQTMQTSDLGMTAPGNNHIQVNTDNLANGVYMYTITTDSYSVSGKFVVNK
ncbi:MAG TPA: T9SS type A sorting domain-containing protein, partial [Bacteroidia bacterium]|nr:T9SS type A sorting domain-containing protein [Bacteroidia bacterium]